MTAQCSHRSPRGTQCRRSALEGAETCRVHAPGYAPPKRAARTVAAVPAGTVPGLSGHARVVALAELAHEATSAAVSERAHGLAADLAEDACIAWVRSVSAALAWLLDDSTASAVSLAPQPAGPAAEPVEAVEPDAMARDPRVAPRCGDCGECAICDAVLAYEDRAKVPRDAHEAPLAHESADDPRRHTGVPVVDVAGTHRDAAAPRLGVEERQIAATRMVRRFARYTTLRSAVEEALSANERRCLDDDADRAAVVEAVLAAIAASPDAMFVRELLGADRLSWLSRAMAHGMTAQRLVDAAWRLSGGE